MKQERVILSFIMVVIGLLVAGAAFYFYQTTKVVSTNSSALANPTPTESPKSTIFLSINTPASEEVVSNKTLIISGKTLPQATIVIVTNSDQLVVKPSTQGDFSTTVTLENDQNLIRIHSLSSNGEIATVERTVTYSTNSF
ncbi:MAG: hypothetical protein AAB702_01390 [Patescibacteria group bacterium]